MNSRTKETDFADIYVCDNDSDWHSYYYIAPLPSEAAPPWYCINRAGIEMRLPDLFYISRTSATPYCELFCIISGRGSLTYRGEEWPLREGNVVLLASGESHSYKSDRKFPMGMLWIEYYGGDSASIARRILSKNPPVQEGDVFPACLDCMNTIEQQLMANEQFDPAVELYKLQWLLLRNSEGVFPFAAGSYGDFFAHINSYIDAHISEDIAIADIARLCRVSPSYLSRRFKADCRVTPREYIMNRRITRAKYLLTETDMPVDAISSVLGFCNSSHFIRRFKNAESITPAHYRKQYSLFPGR